MKNVFLSFTFLFALSISIFSSQTGCKKDKTETTPEKIEGLWIGTYTVNNQPSLGQQYYSFIIKPDGTIIVDGKGNNNTDQYISEGTWTLTGNTFNATFSNIYSSAPPSQIGVVQNATATFDDSGKLTSGIWTTPANPSNKGTFTMNRVN